MRDTLASDSPTMRASALFDTPSRSAARSAAFVRTGPSAGTGATPVRVTPVGTISPEIIYGIYCSRANREPRTETRRTPNPLEAGSWKLEAGSWKLEADMIYRALATDYDGTLAQDGLVDDITIEALRRARA